MKQFNRII